MNKRGQVSTFAIIGIILVVLIALFLFLRGKVYFGTASEKSLEEEFPPIEEHIKFCLIEKGNERIRQMGLQGGYLDPAENSYLPYLNREVSYRGWDIPAQRYCRTRLLTEKDMEQELSLKLKDDLRTQCLNIGSFKKIGSNIDEIGELTIDVDIGEDVTTLTANQKIRISKNDVSVEKDKFTANVNLPLGRLYDVSVDIVREECSSGIFDTLLYNIAKTQTTNKPYICQKLQPYPDKLYICKIKDIPTPDNEFIFEFAIEDEPRRGL